MRRADEPKTADPRAWRPGDFVADRYRIDSRIGLGGTAVVHRALDTRFDRWVALKVPFDAETNELQRQRILREAHLVASLNHPGIVRVYELEFLDGTPVIVMEYLEGRSLHELLGRDARFSAVDAVHWLRRILDALAVAHRAGVLHRDVKPTNILLTTERRVVLLDFGIGVREHAAGKRLTPDGAVLGTPAYLAPELLLGNSIPGPSLDVYSVGVIAFRMLTGQLPFTLEFPALIGQILHEPAPYPHHIEPSIPTPLSAFVRHALEKDPKDRFRDAVVMRDALLAAFGAASDRPSPTE